LTRTPNNEEHGSTPESTENDQWSSADCIGYQDEDDDGCYFQTCQDCCDDEWLAESCLAEEDWKVSFCGEGGIDSLHEE